MIVPNLTAMNSSRQRGLSLIELMVALTISAVLIFGATQVYVDSRNAYNINETVARLQETARYALSVIEPDMRMADYWGLVKGGSNIVNRAAQTAPAAPAAPGALANVCGTNFAVDLDTALQGDNNGYVLSPTRQAACDSLSGWNTSAVASADTLTVRRASTTPSANGAGNPLPVAGNLQVCSNRLGGALFSDGSPCGTAPANQVNNVIVNAYYADNNSGQAAGLPSLRRKSLISSGGMVQFADQEVIAGVEDLQVQFGIDRTASGVATSYVNPNAVPAGAQVVAVRLWLLVRSDTPEVGFTDNRIYEYGDRSQANGTVSDLNTGGSATKAFQPSGNPGNALTNPMHYRRLLVTRTFQIRNAEGT